MIKNFKLVHQISSYSHIPQRPDTGITQNMRMKNDSIAKVQNKSINCQFL